MSVNRLSLILLLAITVISFRFESFAIDDFPIVRNFYSKSATINPEIEEVVEATFPIASNISVSAGENLVVTTNISLPSNVSIVGTYLILSGVTVGAGTWASDVSILMEGASSLNSQPVANVNNQMIGGGPFSYACSSIESSGGEVALIFSHNYPWGGPMTIDNVNLVVVYSTTVETINLCQGSSVILTTDNSLGSTYQWNLDGEIIPDATSFSFTANASGSYTVVVTNSSTCSATSPATVVTVNALPTATINPATAITFCQGVGVVLFANTGTGLSYQWRLNGNPISGATSSSYTANASGSYTVVVTNTSTCSATSAATVATVNAPPTATINAATATTFCQGSSVVLSANTGTGLSYQWRLNGNPISGATSSSYTANVSGSYTVLVTNTSGCSATSAATVVTVNALPTVTTAAATTTTFCQGGSVVLNANTGSGFMYQWRLNGSNISGANSSSFNANQGGTYTVTIANSNGCSATSIGTVVTVNSLPTATITAATATTFCQGGSVILNANTGTAFMYQWYNNASLISGAISSSYTVNASGSYLVVVTNNASCSATSSATNVLVNSNTTYFADTDNDGSGNSGNSLSTCVQPSGYVLNSLDCNDANAAINPAAAEICNSIDDNCNSQTDEGLAFTLYYADADGDGFGSPIQEFPSCVPLSGMVMNNADCNDNNTTISPSAVEIGGNGIDENCDSLIDNASSAQCSGPPPGVICAEGQSTTICAPSWPWLPGQWRFNGGPVFSQSYCVTVAEPGSYTCTALNHFTAQTLTFGYSVILDTPTTPTISCSVQPLGNNQAYITLTASNGNGYLWSTGETSQTITVPNLGGYSVQVLNGNCCPETSLPTGVFSNPGCTDSEACNYNSYADCNNGSCVYPGCTNPQACNFDPTAGCDDGSCLTVYGCSNPVACNYNSIVVCDDGSCIYPGCTNPQAANYNALAGCDDGSCSFAVTFRVDMSYVSGFSIPEVNGTFNGWWGGQMTDSNSDGIWEATLSIPAGSYEYKFAYDYWSGQENLLEGSPCTITNSGYTNRTLNVNSSTILPVVCWGFCSACSEVIGCTDSLACNYDSTAGINDGTCNYGGCLNDLACNYDPTSMCDNGSCIFPGCNNPIACNFNALAGCDDGSCILPGCTDINACNYNSATTCDDGSCVFPGCTVAASCNFDPNAGCDDGSCIVNYMSCNDNNPATIFDSWYNPVDFGVPFPTCICTGPQLLFGTINSDEIVLCPNQEVYSLTVNVLPQLSYDPINPFDTNGSPIEINSNDYDVQWYFRSGNNSAPTGSSTSGWNLISGATSTSLTISPFTGTRTYACFVTPDASYGISGNWMSGAKVLTYSSFAAQTIIGNPNITPFNAYNYIINPIPGHTYSWTVTNGAIASGQGTNNVSIMWGQNGPYQLTLAESDGTCTGSSYLFAVNNNCSISVSAASASTNTFCAGTTLQLQAATSATGITYQWYLNGTLIPNETNQNISVSSGGNYQVSINQNGCTAVSNIVSINQLPSAIIPNILVEQANAGCAGGEATLTVSGGTYTNLLWNNGLTASSINVNASGDFSITAIDENGCAVSAGPVSVNFSILDPVPVCIVTVDQVTGKNNVVWEPVTSDLINSYVVLKETNVANEYAQIGTVAYGSNGIFEDVNSDPQIQANRYKLALIDTCGILSSASNFHKTIHLTANQGIGSNVNLIWSDYEGFDFGSYSIYRGSSASSLNLLTTIASNLNSFTDVNPPTGETYYMIEVAGVSCDPQRTLVYSHSNILDSTVGIEEFTSTRISLYPNPASTSITLQVSTPLIGEEYVVFDTVGKVIYKNRIQSTNEVIHLENFNTGNYFIKINEVVKRFEVIK